MKAAISSLRRQVVLAAVAMSLTAFSLWAARPAHQGEHVQVLGAITDSEQAQSRLQQQVLLTRLGVTTDYDSLNEALSVLQTSQSRMTTHAEIVVGDRTALREALDSLAVTSSEKAVAVEDFKTQVSKYRNSLTYLPAALDNLMNPASGQRLDAVYAETAQDLVRLALTYNATPNEQSRGALASVLERAQEMPIPAADPRSWSVFLRHIQLVLEVTQPLGETAQDLLRPDLQRDVGSVHSAYMDAYQRVQHTRTTFQRASYALLAICAFLFGQLLLRLRRLYATLESRIARRTEELAEMVASSRLILDNVGEGLVAVDLAGRPGTQTSSTLVEWLGTPHTTETFWQWVERFAPEQAEWLELGWSDLRDGFMPYEVILAQLPIRMQLEQRVLSLRYHAIMGSTGTLEGVLVIMRDITRQEAAEALQRRDAERVQLLTHAVTDRDGLSECLTQTTELLNRLAQSRGEPVLAKRQLHTVKGNVGMYGMNEMAEACHTLETRLLEQGVGPSDMDVANLQELWAGYRETLAPFYQDQDETRRYRGQLKAMAELIEQQAPYELLQATASSWSEDVMAQRLARLARNAENTARHLNRPVQVHLEDNDLRVPANVLDPLWSVVPHIVRNAIDHGLEDPEERKAAGKSLIGGLFLSTRRVGDSFVLGIRDNGGGIRWDRLRAKAEMLNLPSDSRSDLEAALFVDGVSSRELVSQISGRGIGMAAVKQVVESLGGSIRIASTPGAGTRFECVIPDVFEQRSRMTG